MAKVEEKSFSEVMRELWALLRDYGKQETLEPLRGLGRYLGFGIVGSVLIALGVLLLLLGLLRMVQAQYPDVFDGSWEFAPYVFGFVGCLVVMGLAAFRISREPKRKV